MRLIPSIAVKSLGDLKPGELFSIWIREQLVRAIHIGPGDKDARRLCVFFEDAGRNPEFFARDLAANEKVVSYGIDWILEFGHGDAVRPPGDNEHRNSAGVLVVESDDALLNVTTVDKWQDKSLAHIRLDNWAFEAPQGTTACVVRWSIWVNEQHRSRPGADPWFTFDVAA